jgi:Fic family protein
MAKEPIKIEAYKSGHREKGAGFRYFVPEEIDREWNWQDGTLSELLERAARKLGELNAFARLVPNIDLFIHLHIMKEAVLSSRIEGTHTNMDEALLPIDEIEPEKRDDWNEVQRYTSAMNEGIEKLAGVPISTRLLKEIHKTLLTDARGTHKQPGEFRTSQNWIGGASISDAKFIPPSQTMVNPLMGDLENFLHNKDLHLPALIRIGVAHYQFETIHPFLDGNGRIGRLLITLFLVSEGILDKPLLYLSAFFERNKELYYDNLTNVREKNDMLQWLKYFLVGIEETASKSVETLAKVLRLKEEIETAIHLQLGRRHRSAALLIIRLFKEPFITVKNVMSICELSNKAAGGLIDAFVKHGWLEEMTGASRNRVFMFKPYLALFD